MQTSFQNFIDGECVEGPGSSHSVNPSNLSDIIGEYARADAAQAKTAITAARTAFPAWSTSGILSRADILDKMICPPPGWATMCLSAGARDRVTVLASKEPSRASLILSSRLLT